MLIREHAAWAVLCNCRYERACPVMAATAAELRLVLDGEAAFAGQIYYHLTGERDLGLDVWDVDRPPLPGGTAQDRVTDRLRRTRIATEAFDALQIKAERQRMEASK